MNKNFKFTSESISDLPKAKKGNRYMVYDTVIPQLAVRVTDLGSKSFLIQKRQNGRILKITIGKYPEIKVARAREIAISELNKLAEGINPNEEKHKLRKETNLEELFKEYMERYSKKSKKSWKYDEREIPKFLGHWFRRKISDVSKQNIQSLHEKISEENGAYQANRMLERIKSMYNKAIEWGWDGVNPANGIKKNKEVKRDRFLQPKEFPEFFKALDEEQSEVAKNYIWISLFTGARKSNVLAMRWDFDLKMWRIPDTKNGEPLNVPLTENTIKLLSSIDRVSEWVFPSQKSSVGHLQDPKKAWKRILTKAGITNLRIHDIRRTLGSYQAITGASLPIIGKTLGHKSQSATQIYARLDYDPVRASMEDALAKMLGYRKQE